MKRCCDYITNWILLGSLDHPKRTFPKQKPIGPSDETVGFVCFPLTFREILALQVEVVILHIQRKRGLCTGKAGLPGQRMVL